MTGVLHSEYRILPTGGVAVGFWTAQCKKCTYRATKHGNNQALHEAIEKHLSEAHGISP